MADAASSRTILIVDDESLVRMVAAEYLRDAGYIVEEAEDSNAALNMLRTGGKLDLLLTDVKMPHMSGYQLAEEALAERPGIKILIMTGYAQESLPQEMVKAGVEVLYKPFDMNLLVERTGEILQTKPD